MNQSSIKNQAEERRLQDELGKQNFHENIKKIHEALIDTLEDTSEILIKTFLGKRILITTKQKRSLTKKF